MWKAVLILFMTSTSQPISTMVGQFPESFTKKSACLEFINKRDTEISDTVSIFSEHAELGFTVLTHNLQCMEDDRGEPV